MKYKLLLASRSTCNESIGKDTYGCIVKKNTDIVICYVPNHKQAKLVLNALRSYKSKG
jgi:hypothetical protein